MWLLVPLGLARLALHLLRRLSHLAQALMKRSRGRAGGQQSQPRETEFDSGVSPALLEQLIEQVSARQVTELRAIIEEIRQVYATEVLVKERQLGELHQRVAVSEREEGQLAASGQQEAEANQAESLSLERPQSPSSEPAAPKPPSTRLIGQLDPANASPGPDPVSLPQTRPLYVGRHASNELRIADPRISCVHAQITYDGGVYAITDLDSTNGIYVNGEQIPRHSTRVTLHEGDVIEFGGRGVVTFAFHLRPLAQPPTVPRS
jgi:hypothetical protein